MDNAAELVSFWIREQKFFELPIKTVLVTATMSAGKSTLINAIVGKRLMRTAQEACTGHICNIDQQIVLTISESLFCCYTVASIDSRIDTGSIYNTNTILHIQKKKLNGSSYLLTALCL